MPVYEYKCKSCGEKFDILHGFQEQVKEPECPKCGSHDTQRVFSVCGGGSSSSCAPAPSSFKFG